jgi:hypothetical protein
VVVVVRERERGMGKYGDGMMRWKGIKHEP